MRGYLRALGAKVGERVFWDTAPPIETRALDIEDDVVVEDGAMLLGHVVDHAVLQFGPIHIGKGSVINTFVNVQPHTQIGSNVLVDSLSTVMKHDTLPDSTTWVGSPCVRRAGSSGQAAKPRTAHFSWGGSDDNEALLPSGRLPGPSQRQSLLIQCLMMALVLLGLGLLLLVVYFWSDQQLQLEDQANQPRLGRQGR